MSKIKTTGELREFLATMLVGIKTGDVKHEEARAMTKMAAQINESFYSEIKIAKTQIEAGKAAVDLGTLPINK